MTKLLIDDAGWMPTVEAIQSPNFDARPDNSKIKLIVVHGISLPPGEFGGGYIQKFFCNNLTVSEHDYFASISELKVSAHCLIDRQGEIVQFVSFLDRAWHAGVSEWQGETSCNDFSIGIELEGVDDIAYTPEQYQGLAGLVQSLISKFPDISRDAVTGHSNIAPQRKTDPGPAFNWEELNYLIGQ
jgi:AmpD protein